MSRQKLTLSTSPLRHVFSFEISQKFKSASQIADPSLKP
jgi:hypothetical protein